MTWNPPKDSLKPLIEDPRDFPLGALSAIPDLSEVKPLGIRPPNIYNQISDGNDDFCSAYAVCGALERDEGIALSPEFQFASSKEISGDPENWGQDLRSAMKAPLVHGIAERRDILVPQNPTDRRYFKNYVDEVKKRAQLHKQRTYFKTSGPYSPVDNVRSWIWKYQKPAILGVSWGWNLSDYELKGTPDGFGHAVYAVDFDDEGNLLVVNSAGRGAGRDGMHILSRDTANEYITKYGAYMHQDVSKEEAQMAVDMYRSGAPWWRKLFIRLFY